MQKEVPQLFFHQGQATQFITPLNGFALFMEMGTGKSRVVIEKFIQLYEEGEVDCMIIISPNAVAPQWVEEQFPGHYPSDFYNSLLWKGCSTIKEKGFFHSYVENKTKPFIFSINVESFQSNNIDLYMKMVIEERKVFLIIDESTSIKNGRRKPKKGKRSGAKRTNKLLDFSELIKHKAVMTGTPTPNTPFDLWSQFEFLQKNFFEMDYPYFEHHYGIILQRRAEGGKKYSVILDEKYYNLIKKRLDRHNNNLVIPEKEGIGSIKEETFGPLTPQIIEEIAIDYNMKTKDVILINKMDKYYPYKNLEELHKKISKITFYAKKSECVDIPEKLRDKLYCKLSPEQDKIYKQLQKEMYSKYFDKEITLTNKLVMSLRLQMVTGGLFPYSETNMKIDKNGEEFFETKFKTERIKDSTKIKVLMEDLQEVSPETSVIIWARFRGEIDLICDSLKNAGYTVGKYYGGSSDSVIEEFKQGRIKYLVANPLKGGQGLNLQISTLHYSYSNSYKSDTKLQSEDRSHRIGQTNHVLYKEIICRGTLDMRIYNILKRKESLINYFRSDGHDQPWEMVA